MINKKLGMDKEKWGVVVIAPGCKEANCSEAMQQAVHQVKLPYPKALGFLEYARPDIRAAAKDLEQQGVNKIIAVPIFISSHSSQIERVNYVLGLRTSLAEKAEGVAPIRIQAEILLTHALDAHPLVAEILAEYLMAMSQQPDEEIAVLVAEGTNTTGGQEKLREDLASLAAQIKAKLSLKDVRYGFLAMGSPPAQAVVSQAQTEGRVLVVPVLLNEEGSRKGIPQLLDGLNYVYIGKALAPHPNISRFIEWRVSETVLSPLQFRKGGKSVSLSLNDAQNLAMAAGSEYPYLCSVLAFRLARLALDSLWENEPAVDDLEVISYLPPEVGSRPVFESIAGAANVTYKGDWSEITSESPTFIFKDRATGLALRIKVKEITFGGKDFFGVRNRVINQKSASGEEQLLAGYLQETLSNLLLKPDTKLFSWTNALVQPEHV